MTPKNGSQPEPIWLGPGRPRRGELSVLKKIGITKKLSMQAQALASMPEPMREDVIAGRMSLTAAVECYLLAKRLVREGHEL